MEAVIEAEMQSVVATAVQAAFDYAEIDEGVRDEVKQAARTIRQLEQGVITGVLAIGKRLQEVKDMLPHGQFTAWIMGEFGMEERSAQRMMSVAREYSDPQKRQTLSLFSPSVAYLLAAPSMPDAARIEVEQAAAAGQKVTVAFAKEAIRKAKPEPVPEMPRDLARAGYRLWNLYADGDGRQWRWHLKKGFENVAFGPFVATPEEAIVTAREDFEERRTAAHQAQARAVYVEPASVEPPAAPTTLLTPSDLAAGAAAVVAAVSRQIVLTDLTIMDGRLAAAVGSASLEELQASLAIVPADAVGRRGVLEHAIKKRGGKLGLTVAEPEPPFEMPADLVAAGYSLVVLGNPKGRMWAWQLEGNPYYSNSRYDVREVIDEAREHMLSLTPPLPVADSRIVEAQELITALAEARRLVNLNYGELCGTYTDSLAWFRGTETMIERLESLVGILTKKEKVDDRVPA